MKYWNIFYMGLFSGLNAVFYAYQFNNNMPQSLSLSLIFLCLSCYLFGVFDGSPLIGKIPNMRIEMKKAKGRFE